MSVFRVNKNKNYTVMSNYHLKDKNLSLKAKGLLSQMLSLPDDWDYTVGGLCAINKEGKDSIRTTLQELEKRGYLKRTLVRDEKGNFADQIYDIFEEPNADYPQSENPTSGNPISENPTQLNTNIQTTDKQNTNNVERKKEEAFDDVFVRKKVSPELKDAFVELIKSRKLNNKKMTNRALELAIDKVRQLEDDEYYQIEIVNQSVANGWQGLFPLKDKKAKEIPHNELSKIEDDGDVTWKRVFDFWRQTLGYEDFITNQSVYAAKKLLEMDGEEGVKKLIVALRMRSQHRYLSSEIRNVSSLVDLLDHRQAIWGFYNLHAEDWGRQMKQSLQGKKRWQL